MAWRNDWEQYIRAQAARYRLDPNALIAVAKSEGLSGAVGDNGHAFGPFQLNDAGGVLTGRPGDHRAFAESNAGIDWALGQIAGVAKGLSGNAAISNIVKRFERPQDPAGEIRRALGYYKATGGAIPQQGFVDNRPKGRPNVSAPSEAAFSPDSNPGLLPRQLLASAMAASAQFAQTGHLDQSGMVQALLSPPVQPQGTFQRQAPVASAPQAAPQSAPVSVPNLPAGNSSTAKGLAEAFYDPIGQWDNGRFSPKGIGGHSDHVHVSITNAQAMLEAIKRAQQMGLAARENPYVDKVDPVHTKGSFHYRDFPGLFGGKKLGEGLDVSGDPKLMSAYFRWVLANLR